MKKVSCGRETQMLRIQKELQLSEAMNSAPKSVMLHLPDGSEVKIEPFTDVDCLEYGTNKKYLRSRLHFADVAVNTQISSAAFQKIKLPREV